MHSRCTNINIIYSNYLNNLTYSPCKKRIEYKLLLPVHCALNEGTPVYLALLLLRHTPRNAVPYALLAIYFCTFLESTSNGTVAEHLRALARRCGTLYRTHYGTPGIAHSKKYIKDIFIFKLTSMFYTT